MNSRHHALRSEQRLGVLVEVDKEDAYTLEPFTKEKGERRGKNRKVSPGYNGPRLGRRGGVKGLDGIDSACTDGRSKCI